MALDGIVINRLVKELRDSLSNRKINKIIQHNTDNFILCFQNTNLLLSANAVFPRLYTTNTQESHDEKTSNFYQTLKKYLTNGIIKEIKQIGLDRIVIFEIEALNDFKDVVRYKLIIEIMGKYSNIILTDADDNIIDAYKLVNNYISSVRMILPKLKYVLPKEEKLNLLTADEDSIRNALQTFFLNLRVEDISSEMMFAKFISSNFLGISNSFANNYVSQLNEKTNANKKEYKNTLDLNNIENIFKLKDYIQSFQTNCIIFLNDENQVEDFHIIDNFNHNNNKMRFNSISEMLTYFYASKATRNNIKQKASDIKLIVTNALSRAEKKKVIHTNTINDAKDCEKYKIYGDLIFSNLYKINPNDNHVEVENYYDNNVKIDIKLDKDLSASDNANKYYQKYNKKKAALKYSTIQLKDVDEEIVYLETIISYIENALTYSDIEVIKDELMQSGYIKKKYFNEKNGKNSNKNKGNKKKSNISTPMHYISSDGFDIYVGKNNIQNDEVTFKIGRESDIWLHVKDMPGSHVIIKLNGTSQENLPEQTLLEAAHLGVYNSKGRESSNVPIDYTERRNVKKPNGSKPGFVIYLKSKTLFITPNQELVNKITKKE